MDAHPARITELGKGDEVHSFLSELSSLQSKAQERRERLHLLDQRRAEAKEKLRVAQEAVLAAKLSATEADACTLRAAQKEQEAFRMASSHMAETQVAQRRALAARAAVEEHMAQSSAVAAKQESLEALFSAGSSGTRSDDAQSTRAHAMLRTLKPALELPSWRRHVCGSLEMSVKALLASLPNEEKESGSSMSDRVVKVLKAVPDDGEGTSLTSLEETLLRYILDTSSF